MGFKQVNEFLSDFKLKKDVEQLVPMLADNLIEIENYYFRKGHKDRETVDRLFEKMSSKKFVKCLKVLQKDGVLDEGIPVIITNFIERNKELDEELVMKYIKIVDKILGDKIKGLSKKVGIDEDIARDILVVVPGEEYIEDKFVGIYVGRVCRKLYTLVKDTNETNIELSPKQIKKMFKFLFKKELIYDAAIQILLEKKDAVKNFNESQLAIWNALTDFALKTLDDLKKDELREKIKRYCVRRARDENDSARRIVLSQIDEEEYPTLSKVVNKMKEKDEEFAKFL